MSSDNLYEHWNLTIFNLRQETSCFRSIRMVQSTGTLQLNFTQSCPFPKYILFHGMNLFLKTRAFLLPPTPSTQEGLFDQISYFGPLVHYLRASTQESRLLVVQRSNKKINKNNLVLHFFPVTCNAVHSS